MAYENLKAQIAEYNKLCDEKSAKTPERQNLKYNRVYTPVDMNVIWVCLANSLTLVAYNLLCTVVVSGQCVCMQASLQQKNLTNVTAT